MSSDCLVAFGSNLGDSDGCYVEICNMWTADARFDSLVASDLITTEPVGSSEDQGNYRNGCIRFRFSDSMADLFCELINVEEKFGRTRRERWGARTVDLDLLLYGKTAAESQTLQVPHPRMNFRRFVLQPACEIAGEMVNPVSGMTIAQHLSLLDSRPNRIAFVVSDQDKFEAAVENEISAFRAVGWKFQFISEIEQIQADEDQIKLLVYSRNLPDESIAMARRFRGATLDAISAAGELDPSELAAAIEAMGPL